MLVEKDRKNAITFTYPNQKPKTAEQKLFDAIFGLDDDIQEIEEEGWYTLDSVNKESLMRFRRINDRYAPVYWSYPTMPDKIEMKRYAEFY